MRFIHLLVRCIKPPTNRKIGKKNVLVVLTFQRASLKTLHSCASQGSVGLSVKLEQRDHCKAALKEREREREGGRERGREGERERESARESAR